MAKTVLGIDVGYDSLKLALVKGRQVKKTAIVPMPNSLVRAGRIVSVETMTDLLRTALKKNGIRCDRAALALPNETVFIRNVTMPIMTEDQLKYNLPFEFRDYITDELKGYVFDYAMISVTEEKESSDAENGEATGGAMEMLAVAAPKSLLDESREYLHKAGMKLVKAAPTVSCFQNLIRKSGAPADREYCILDLGYQAIRMYMFRGDRHIVTRVLEIGMSSLDQVLAEQFGRVSEDGQAKVERGGHGHHALVPEKLKSAVECLSDDGHDRTDGTVFHVVHGVTVHVQDAFDDHREFVLGLVAVACYASREQERVAVVTADGHMSVAYVE